MGVENPFLAVASPMYLYRGPGKLLPRFVRGNSQYNLVLTYRCIRARTFMRFETGQVRFVVVDEPTSVFDSEGEFALFDNLIRAREGKTMIFITHRFGHLTKRADLVV